MAGRGPQPLPDPSCPGQGGSARRAVIRDGDGPPQPPLIRGADVSPSSSVRTRRSQLDRLLMLFSPPFSSTGCWSRSGNAQDFMMHRKCSAFFSPPPHPLQMFWRHAEKCFFPVFTLNSVSLFFPCRKDQVFDCPKFPAQVSLSSPLLFFFFFFSYCFAGRERNLWPK